MSLIFYLQLTDQYSDTCLMQNADFKNKSGLCDLTVTFIIQMQLKKKKV